MWKRFANESLKENIFIQKKGLIMVELNLKNIYKKYPNSDHYSV